ncbi:hypothetical protein WS75_06980 [Burkholderia sp. FL-7-2-10-S1-D7]|nr:hypothetical protein WS75_06980 [Burkholderia sp. FL-7-2-10-S1-D7]
MKALGARKQHAVLEPLVALLLERYADTNPLARCFCEAADAVDTSDALFELGGVPWQVAMNDFRTLLVKIDALTADRGADQNVGRKGGVERCTQDNAPIRLDRAV